MTTGCRIHFAIIILTLTGGCGGGEVAENRSEHTGELAPGQDLEELCRSATVVPRGGTFTGALRDRETHAFELVGTGDERVVQVKLDSDSYAWLLVQPDACSLSAPDPAWVSQGRHEEFVNFVDDQPGRHYRIFVTSIFGDPPDANRRAPYSLRVGSFTECERDELDCQRCWNDSSEVEWSFCEDCSLYGNEAECTRDGNCLSWSDDWCYGW
jgi:hypothetical protein